ncbi:MAG: phage tail family protein [Actinomycetota bacterium]|nr:phage tail family protein [Actinomycetota bacterium]
MARELRWIAADGESIVLNDERAGYKVTKGVTGLGVAPVEHVTETTPLLDGEIITDTYEAGRTIMLPMVITAPDNGLLRGRLRALVDALDPRSPGHLEVAQSDGQRRRIRAVYSAGLEGVEDKDSGGDTTWYRFVLRLYCPDPAFFDPNPITLSFPYPEPVPFFPILPVTLSADSVLGVVAIHNPGDLAAWPAWTATAPGTAVALDNEDTGEELHLTGTLTDTLTIVTRPGEQSIRMGTADWWGNLTGTPQFWQLPPGTTNASLALTGAGPGSSIGLSFVARYRKAW